MKKIILLLSLLLLSGCAKTTDIEDRNYVMVLGLDKAEGQLEATYSFAKLRKAGSSDVEEDTSDIITIRGLTLAKIEEEYKTFQDKKLELGHLRSLVLGEALIADKEMKSRVLKELEDNPEYSRTVLCYTTENTAKEMLETERQLQGFLSDYLSDMFYNNMQKSSERPITLEHLLASVNEGQQAAVPNLTTVDGCPAVKSYYLFENGEIWKKITVEEYQLYQLIHGRIPYQTVWLDGLETEFIKVNARQQDRMKLKGVVKISGEMEKEELNRRIQLGLEDFYQELYGEKAVIETEFIVQ